MSLGRCTQKKLIIEKVAFASDSPVILLEKSPTVTGTLIICNNS